MARVKRAVAQQEAPPRTSSSGPRATTATRAARTGRQRAGHALGAVRVPRPPGPQGRVPPALDPAHQRGLPPERHQLQPVHRRPAAGRASRSTARCWPTSPSPTRRRSPPWSRSPPRPLPRQRLNAARAARLRRRRRLTLSAPHNPRVQRLRRLSGRRSARPDEGAFVVEGPVLVREALRRGWRLEEVFVAPAARRRSTVDGRRCATSASGSVLPSALARPPTRCTPRPVAAVAPLRSPARARRAGGRRVVLVLVDVADPGNAGTLLRSAEAAGRRAVVFCARRRSTRQPEVRAGRRPARCSTSRWSWRRRRSTSLDGLGQLGTRRRRHRRTGGGRLRRGRPHRAASPRARQRGARAARRDRASIDERVTIPMAGGESRSTWRWPRPSCASRSPASAGAVRCTGPIGDAGAAWAVCMPHR